MDYDLVVSYELSLLASHIRREVINVLDSFLSFLKVYDKRKTHNMISLMQDLRYKTLLYSILICWKEEGILLIEEYDRKSLYPMLVKCMSICILWWGQRGIWPWYFFIKIAIWIYLNKMQAQVNQRKNLSRGSYWFSRGINWMLKTSNVLFNDGRNMKQYFL